MQAIPRSADRQAIASKLAPTTSPGLERGKRRTPAVVPPGFFISAGSWREKEGFGACKPDFVPGLAAVAHPFFSRPLRSTPGAATAGLCRPRAPGATYPGRTDGPSRPLFGLAPGWVSRATDVTVGAVGSYPTFSLSPLDRTSVSPSWTKGLLVFCDTIRRAALKRRAPACEGNPALWCLDFPLSSKNGANARLRNRAHPTAHPTRSNRQSEPPEGSLPASLVRE